MLNCLLWYWLMAWAIATPVSIAGTSLLFFPLLTLYTLLGAWTFRRWPPPWGPVEKAFLVFWLISALSALLGVDPRHSLTRLSKDLYFAMLVLLGAYLARERAGSNLLKICMIASIGTAVFGVLQFLIGVNQSDSAHGILIDLPHWLDPAPRALVDALSMVKGRVTGTRAHPLTYAEGLLFPLGYTLSKLATRRLGWGKWAAGLFLVLLALVVSQSRGPWIAAVVMGLVLCFLRRDVLLYKRLALVALPILLCFLSPTLHKRAFSISDTHYDPNTERLDMWQAGLRMVQDHPFFGIGTGTMNLVSPQYQSDERRVEGPWGHLHDTFVNVAAERGLVGLLAFLSFIVVLARELWRGYRRAATQADEDSQIILLTGLLGLVGWLVAGFTETVYHDSNVLMVFYFVMGIAVATSRDSLKNLKRM